MILAASHAFTVRQGLSNKYKFGEGIAGQSAMEREPIIVSDVPSDHYEIVSGVGKSRPKCIIACPIIMNNELKGVIELAGFRKYDHSDIDLLTSVSESIAIALEVAESKQKMHQLLEESDNQKEILEQNNKEITIQSENLRESENRLQKQSEKLKLVNETLEEKSESLEHQKDELEKKSNEILKSKEEIEKKAKELAQASQYKSEFLANMSHELRTPLNSLLILSKSLSENEHDHLDEEEVESAKIIHDGGLSLLNLINDILDLSKVEAGKMEVHLDALSLETFAERIRRQFGHVAKERKLEFSVTINSDLPDYITTDHKKIEQVVRNLLSNAMKFTQSGSVKLNIIHLKSHTLTNGHDAIGFEVTDTGIGIAEENIKAIFQSFQQEDGSTSRQYGGTGLGLAISREMSRILGGNVDLRSFKGEGSTFTLCVPLVIPSQSLTSAPASNMMTPKPMTEDYQGTGIIKTGSGNTDPIVLIVEDGSAEQFNLGRIVQSLSFAHDKVKTGKDAIEMISHKNYDCMILDLGLPDMTGFEVLDKLGQLRIDNGLQAPPVIVYTARSLTEDEFARLGDPVHNVIQKESESTDKLIKAISSLSYASINAPCTEKQEETKLKSERPEPTRKKNAGTVQQINSVATEETKPVNAKPNNVAKKAEGFNGEVVLLVDDDMRNIFALSKYLRSANLTVVQATNGEMAIEKVKSESIDIVLMDLMMPVMDGYEAIKMIRADEKYNGLPIIALTARAMQEDRNKCIEIGANDYLSKPVDTDKLKAILKIWLSGSEKKNVA